MAPTGGTVGDIPVRVGDLVTSQTLLTTLDDNSALEVYVDVPLERAATLEAGDAASRSSTSRARSLRRARSTSSRRAPIPQTQTVLVKANVDNRAGRLRAAQFVRARVVWRQHDGPVVPVLAVQRRAGQAFVWVAERATDGALTAALRVVQIGPIEGQSYPVTGGLQAGDRIVASGVQKLRPGAPRRAASQAAPSGEELSGSSCSSTSSSAARSSRRSARSSSCSSGAVSIPTLPIAQYPELAPPQVRCTASTPAPAPQVVESAVTTPLEQQINGAEGMSYMTSTSGNDGSSNITATFDVDRDMDLAAVDVQNRVNTALGRLPDEVKKTGVTVTKTSTAIVLVVGFYSDDEPLSNVSSATTSTSTCATRSSASRASPTCTIFGERKYAMRIWLDPVRLAARGLTASDVVAALREQNVSIAAGAGRPAAGAGRADLPDQRARRRAAGRAARVRAPRPQAQRRRRDSSGCATSAAPSWAPRTTR